MRATKVQASLRIRAVSPEPPLLAHTSSDSRGTFRQQAISMAPLNGWACAVKICHYGMLEDTNSLDAVHLAIYYSFSFTEALNREVLLFVASVLLGLLNRLVKGGGAEESFPHCPFSLALTTSCIRADTYLNVADRFTSLTIASPFLYLGKATCSVSLQFWLQQLLCAHSR